MKSAIIVLIGSDELKLEKLNSDEAFRYMGQRGDLSAELREVAEECEKRLLKAISPKFVYAVFDLENGEEITVREALHLPC